MKKKFTVTNDSSEIPVVLSQLNEIYQPWIPEKDWLQCELAVVEGFTNAALHAHKNLPPTTTIEIEITITPQSMEIRIFDLGPSFDLAGYIQELEERNEENCGHGRGIPILVKIADHLSYERTNDNQGNCLFLIKKFSHTITENNQ